MLPEESLPGQTPLDDISGLRVRGITTASQLNAVEAENIRKATLKYLAAGPSRRAAPFTVKWALRLHREMFGDVWKWAGMPRTSDGFNVGSPFHTIDLELHDLFEDLRAWETSDMPLLEQAVRLHHGAVRIHPFRNGNGRWSRMLGNIWLKLHGAQPTQWPERVIGTQSPVRDEYLSAIRAADKGNLSPLLLLHQRFARPTAESMES